MNAPDMQEEFSAPLVEVKRPGRFRKFLQAIIHFFVPPSDYFYTYLEEQGELAHRAAQELKRFKKLHPAKVCQTIHDLEHQGDACVHRMEKALAATFNTPIDRDDLRTLTRDLDRILNALYDAIRTCKLAGVDKPSEAMLVQVDTLESVTKEIYGALLNLHRREYYRVEERARVIREYEKQADRIHDEAVYALYHDTNQKPLEVMRYTRVLDMLEEAVDLCEDVADLLSILAVKHG